MHKKLISFLFLMIAAAVPVQAEELLWNGDFNILDPSGDPNGWTVYIENPGASFLGWEDGFYYDGTPCMAAYINETGPGVEVGQYLMYEPNTMSSWDFSCVVNTQWYSTNSWGDLTVEMTYYEPNEPQNPNTDYLYAGYEEFIIFADDMYPVPTTWTPYTYTFTVPPDASEAYLVIRASDWVKGAYVDNVSLTYTDTEHAIPVFPINGETVAWQDQNNCGNGPILNWIPAADAIGDHYVYLGTDPDAVTSATTSDPEYKGTTPLTDPNFVVSLGDIVKGQTYYWRVDETTAGGVVTGNAIARFIVWTGTDIDTFAYASDAALKTVWGANAALTGDVMEISYDNTASPYLTEVEADIADLPICSGDLTAGGNELLMLDIKGNDNMVDSIYVTLESNSGAESGTVQYPDTVELNQQDYEWFRLWPIDLQAFADQGVVLTNVTKVIIGVGTKASPTVGGAGTVQVDYVRLSIPICIADMDPADTNNDCVVDIWDFLNIAGDWLNTEYTVTASAPTKGPILWYKLNEGSGLTVTDSSGNGYDGTIHVTTGGDPNLLWDNTIGAGYNGSNCLDMANQAYIEVPIDAANGGDPNSGAESTVSLWIKDPGQSDGDSMYFKIGSDSTPRVQAYLYATGTMEYIAGYDSLFWPNDNVYTNPDYIQDQWVHLAFVKNASASTMRIYQNGELVAEVAAEGTDSPVLDGTSSFFSIGAWRWQQVDGAGGYLDGLLDDFRVYDYALSQEEVLSLAAKGTATSPLIQPLLTPADVVKSNKVDLDDFAAIAAKWLENVVYP